MTNEGSEPLADQMSGLTLWPDSGYEFAVPGLAGVNSGTAEAALSDRFVAYDEDWFIALHAPYFDRVEYDSKDMYLLHSLAPGESRSFEGWLQVGPSGGLAPVVTAEIERGGMEAGTLSGQIGSAEGPVEDSVLVIEKEGAPYAWTLTPDGSYEVELPAGDYTRSTPPPKATRKRRRSRWPSPAAAASRSTSTTSRRRGRWSSQ